MTRYAFIDRGGCGKPAFFYDDHKPATGDTISAQHITLLDGSKPHTWSKVVCGSCGREIAAAELMVDALKEMRI
ncbi:MAG TPA: hypothetical protein VGU20_16570 [Stellaceae bacterium]|nr:hypothetical protein [Stellaceae bacterium]